MIDRINEIYTRIKDSVSDICGSASMTYVDSPPALPHLYVDQIDNPVSVTDMENSEAAVSPTVEITVYAGTQNEAKKICAAANDCLTGMGFRRSFGPQPVTNVSDTRIKRVVARYTRLIGDGEML